MSAKLYEPGIPNYLFDKKLKPGKHFPKELPLLTAMFNKPNPLKILGHFSPSRRVNEKAKKEISLAEKTFMDFYFPEILANKKQAMHERFINSLDDSLKPAVLGLELQVKKWCTETVNKRLKYYYPQLFPSPQGQYENYCLTLMLLRKNKDDLGQFEIWEWLAKTIEGLDPKLVHRCAYCRKIFFSRQKKKFHSQCWPKYFSEKYVSEGIAKKNQKAYRDRKKEKLKGRKKA